MSQSVEFPPTSGCMDASTAYSQVVFHGVLRSYPPNVPMKCVYTLAAALQAHRRDWVGIFKVGWTNTRDYYTFVWVNSTPDPQQVEEGKHHVLFDAYYLPKEDGEYYQFCYVDNTGQVRGASTPFCFKSPEDLSLQYSFENDLLVITRQDQVENEKQDLYKMEELKLTIENLKAISDERLLEINLLRKTNAELDVKLSRLHQRIDGEKERELEQTLLEGNDKPKVKEEDTPITQQQCLVQNVKMDDLQNENKVLQETAATLKEQHEKAIFKISHLKQEQEDLKRKIEAQESEIAQLNSKHEELQRERQQCLEKQSRLQDQIQLLQVDLQSSQKENVKLSGELRELRTQGEQMKVLQRENQLLQMSVLQREENTQEQCDLLACQLQETKAQLLQQNERYEEAQKRALRFQQELKEVRMQMENQAVLLAEKDDLKSKLECLLMEARGGIEEQACKVEIARLEKEDLSQENQKLRGDIQVLQRQLSEIQAAQSPAVSLHDSNPRSPPPIPQNPEASMTSSLIYGNPYQPDGASSEEERVCRYCKEAFPGIKLCELEQHERSHRTCPFCTLICDFMEQPEFEEHVYGHEE